MENKAALLTAHSYLLAQCDKVTGANCDFFDFTGYFEDEIMDRHLNDILKTLLRASPAACAQLALEGKTSCFLFTKSLEPREVTVSREQGQGSDDKVYTFVENPNSRLEDKLIFEKGVFDDNVKGAAVFSVPELILLKANQKYLDACDAPFNRMENCIGRTIGEFISGFAESPAEKIWNTILASKESNYMQEFSYDGFATGITYWDARKTPIFENGKMKYIFEVNENVTERVMAKKQYNKQNEILMLRNAQLNNQNALLMMQANLLDLSDEAIFTWELNGTILYWNKGAEAMYGYQGEEAVGHASQDMLKSVYPVGLGDIKAILATKNAWSGEIWHTTKDGRRLIVETHQQVIEDERGQLIVLETGRNITQRIEANKKIARQNLILQTINRVYEDAYRCKTVKELGQAYLDIIERATGSKMSFILEVGPEDFVHTVAVSCPPWDADGKYEELHNGTASQSYKIHGFYAGVFKSGKSLLTNAPSSHPDRVGLPKGHPALESFLGVPFLRNGKVAGIVGAANRTGGYRREDQEFLEALAPTVIEVLLRKRAEIELAEAKAFAESQAKLLQTVIDNSVMGIAVVEANGNTLLMNPAALCTLQLNAKDEFDNNGFMDLSSIYEITDMKGNIIPYDQYTRVKALRGEAFTDYVMCSRRKDSGTNFIGSYSAFPICFDKGDMVMTVMTMMDITELVMSQRALEEQKNLQLQAEKEKNEVLQNAIQMKDEFLMTITHEFKTPLSVINSALQTMEIVCPEELTSRIKKYHNIIRQNSNRQLRLVNNLLDVTRMNAGGLKTELANVEIVELTRQIVESIRIYAEQKGIMLSFASNVESGIIGVDWEKYERILLNLLSNAVKFTPEGKSIAVNLLFETVRGKIRLCVLVRDTGVGIPQDKQGYIFEKFGQVGSTRTKQAEGTGIGLHLAKLLVELLGGEISLESTPGKGSVFTVLLPAEKVLESASEKMMRESMECRLTQASELEFSDVYLKQ